MVEVEKTSATSRPDPTGEEADGGVVIERREKYSAVCKWSIANFSKLKQRTTRCLWSKYFEVGGYDCRLLVYPAGDSQALPGYISIYLQVTDPKNASGKWDCFASYRLCVANQVDDAKSISRDSWHRFSAKRKSHGWCDFAPSGVVLDSRSGFAPNDTILVTADILVLSEAVQFSRDVEVSSASVSAGGSEVLSGKFTWKVCNFGLFREMIKSQKIMSPAFPAGECSLRLSVYQSVVSGTDHLSMCLESKDTDKAGPLERSCWCLFRMSVLSQVQGGRHMHRDSYGRFAADSKTGDNTSLGWNDFMSVAAFTDADQGYLLDDTAIFSASFHIIKESSTFNRSVERGLGRSRTGKQKGGTSGDAYQGKFVWKIEHFTRLKELLKKRKITGLCIKSRRFQVGGRDCRLIVYPRGQSQPPNHLSMFLEVTDPSSKTEWSCFVSHRLSVVNQRWDDKSVAKESQNRYSKQAKDWGWREFVTLTQLFDNDAGFLVNDCVVFAAEVLVLREVSEVKQLSAPAAKRQQLLEYEPAAVIRRDATASKARFSWRIENFMAFKEIMETRKIFSKFFTVDGCDLRIGVYESFDTLCIYLESDALGSGLEQNFWVKYKIAVVNQKHPEQTEWKDSSICTKTWNSSVLQFMKVSEMVDPDSGYVQRDGLLVACEVLDCYPWFDFADPDLMASDDEAESLSTDPDELLDSDESDGLSAEDEDALRSLLGRAGLQLMASASSAAVVDMHDLQLVLRDKMQMDSAAAASFVAGLRMYMEDDAYKVKRLLQSGNSAGDGSEGMCLLDLLMGVEVLQQPLLELLLDLMLQCCHQQPKPRQLLQRPRRQPFSPMGATGAAASQLAAYSRFALDGREDGACASSSSSAPVPEPLAIVQSTPEDSSSSGTVSPLEGVASSCATTPESQPALARVQELQVGGATDEAITPEQASRGYINGLGIIGVSGKDKLEEVLQMALSWLRRLDSSTSQGRSGRSSTVRKVQSLLSDLPRSLQPELVMLVPKLVDPAEHTAAAGVLLARLAEANREGSEPEAELRLPVLAALGLLYIDPAVAEKVLRAALDALPALSESEVPPAVGLVLKLASEAPAACTHAVHVVHSRIKSRPDVSPGTLDAVRLAVSQHMDIAQAILADIDSECRSSKPASPIEAHIRDGSGEELKAAIHVADLEILMDLLARPELCPEAMRIFERAVMWGLVSDLEVAVVLERRRMHNLISRGPPPPPPPCFLPEQPATPAGSLTPPFASAPEANSVSGASTLGLPEALNGTDDFESALALAESLAQSKSSRARMFAANLYSTMFRVFSEEGLRGRMLRGLVSRAASSSSALPQNGKASAAGGKTGPSPSNGRHAQSGKASKGASPLKRDPEGAGHAPGSTGEPDVTSPEGLLLTLLTQHGSSMRTALLLMMLEAQRTAAKAGSMRKRVQELESGQDRLLREAKAAAAKSKQEAEKLAERLTDADTQMAQLRGDHSAEAAGFAATKKELEEKVRNLEREVEWVRAEREEERTAMAHERRETTARLKELEVAASRVKTARRDDTKRISKERTQALERCKELEAILHRSEEEVRRLRGLMSTSSATQNSLASKLEEKERQAKEALRLKDDQAKEQEKRVQDLEATLKERQDYIGGLESSLREEMARVAPLYGKHLDRLSAAQLDQLARLHEQGLKQARAHMLQRRSEESAAATAVAAANAVTGGPAPRQQAGQSASATPQRSAASMGSLDSLMSLGLDPSLSSSMRHLTPVDRPGAPGHIGVSFGFGDSAPNGLQRSMTPGIASYHRNNSLQSDAFSQANVSLPNGFPNGLLSGTGLLNGSHNTGNGTHRLW